MGNLQKSLELVQIGEQTAVGTPVAATWQIALPMDFSDTSVIETPPAMTGRAMANAGNVRQAVELATAVTIPATPISAEDFKTLMHFALGVTPTQDGAEIVADELHAHIWDVKYDTIPVVYGATLEHYKSDGTTAECDDYADFFITNFTLSWGRGQMLQFSATGIAQAGTKAQTKANLAAATPPEIQFPHGDLCYYPSSRGDITFDDAMSSIAGTSYAGEMLSGSLSVDTGLVALRASDANSDLAYGAIVLDAGLRKATLEATILTDPGASSLWEVERGKAESAALRAVQLRFLGPPAWNDASFARGTTSRRIQVGFSAKHTPRTYIPSDAEDGQQVVTLSMETHPDPLDTSFLIVTTQSSDVDNAPSVTYDPSA